MENFGQEISISRRDSGKMLVPKSDDAITSATRLLLKINTHVTKIINIY